MTFIRILAGRKQAYWDSLLEEREKERKDSILTARLDTVDFRSSIKLLLGFPMNSSNSNDNDYSSNSTGPTNSIGGPDRHDLGLYFLDQARLSSVSSPLAGDEAEEEEAPTELNTINSSGGFLVVSTDKLSVKYTSVNLHGHDVGAVQANKPAPVKRLLYYFEMYVKDAGDRGHVSIGFTSESFKMRRQPG